MTLTDAIFFRVLVNARAELWLACNSRKLFGSSNDSFSSSFTHWCKIIPQQASQSIPIEVVYEKEGFLYKKEGVSVQMRKETHQALFQF